MSNDVETRSGGIGFLGVLAIVFIVLRLTHTIAWSWWWVLAPLWAPIAIGLVFLGVGGLIALLLLAMKR